MKPPGPVTIPPYSAAARWALRASVARAPEATCRAHEVGQVEVEDDVAVDEQERLVAEEAPHLARPAAGAQQLPLEGVRDAQARAPVRPPPPGARSRADGAG